MQLHFFGRIVIIRKAQQREDVRMAASKGRKNGKKRAQTRRSPQNQAEHEQLKQTENKKKGFWSSGLEVVDPVNLIGFILMVVGFLVAVVGDFGLYAYPVTFIGAFLCLIRTKPDTRSNKISVAVYIIYLLSVIYLWVGCLHGNA